MGFHIIVCVKAVVTEITGVETTRSGELCELNPFDRPVLDVAVQLKDRYKGTITALSMGPSSVDFALLEAMALGADRGVLICDPALRGSDTIATSNALAAAAKRLAPFDLILFGTQTADSDAGQVGPQTAVLLDLPLVTWAHTIEPEDDRLRIERRSDGFCDTYEVRFPAALTIHPRATDPKEPRLSEIQRAFTTEKVETLGLADIDLSPDAVGEDHSPTRVLSIRPVKKDRSCEILPGSIEEQAAALVGRLTEKAVLR